MESATEVRYAGVVVGRGAPLRDRDDAGVFVVFAEPLPVGTPVWLKIEDAERTARVIGVVESADANLAGMRLRFVAESEVARSAPKPVAAPAPAPTRREAAAPAPTPEVAPAADAAPAVAEVPAAEASGVADAPVGSAVAADSAVGGGAAVPSVVEGDASSAAGSGKRRRKRR